MTGHRSSAVLVYGELGDHGLVFVPEPACRELCELQNALKTATTWGELRGLVTSMRWAEITTRARGDEDAMLDDEEMDTAEISGYADGDWPEWPEQQMLDWMPADLQSEFGGVDTSSLNGPFLTIEPRHEKEIVAALTARGFRCVRDDAQVSRASGW